MQSATIRIDPRTATGRHDPSRRSQPVRLPPGTADLVNRLLEQRCGGKPAAAR